LIFSSACACSTPIELPRKLAEDNDPLALLASTRQRWVCSENVRIVARAHELMQSNAVLCAQRHYTLHLPRQHTSTTAEDSPQLCIAV
jgi:hypothetical protein